MDIRIAGSTSIPAELSAADLDVGEIVYCGPYNEPSEAGLRLVTSHGIFKLSGEFVTNKSDNQKYYHRLRSGTQIIITP